MDIPFSRNIKEAGVGGLQDKIQRRFMQNDSGKKIVILA
jgi:hypothetical protein